MVHIHSLQTHPQSSAAEQHTEEWLATMQGHTRNNAGNACRDEPVSLSCFLASLRFVNVSLSNVAPCSFVKNIL
jgi:hypothetical protein